MEGVRQGEPRKFRLAAAAAAAAAESLSRVRLGATHGLQPTRLLRPWDFPGKSTGVGCHCLLRGYLLLTQ